MKFLCALLSNPQKIMTYSHQANANAISLVDWLSISIDLAIQTKNFAFGFAFDWCE